MNRARRARFSIGLVIVGLACGPASVASARVSAHCPAMRGEVVASSASVEVSREAVTVLDDRPDLNTTPDAGQARFVHVPDYADIARHLPEGPQHYVVLMSFGYRTDKIVLRQLLGKAYRYLGMLGSAEKVKTLFRELQTEGIPPDALQAVHAPVGLPIHSRTPAEIAVSILAELILVKNSADPDI